MIREDQRRLTFEEFLTVYADIHAEWLPSGEVVLPMSKNLSHQLLLGFLYQVLSLFLAMKGMGRVIIDGLPQRLGDDLPAREPDLIVLLPPYDDRLTETHLNGAADIAVEIVSPERIARDYGDKFYEYEAGGVREYWLFDPDRTIANVYALNADGEYRLVPRDAAGRLVSTLLPGFALPVEVLWDEPYPEGKALIDLVRAMTEADANE